MYKKKILKTVIRTTNHLLIKHFLKKKSLDTDELYSFSYSWHEYYPFFKDIGMEINFIL